MNISTYESKINALEAGGGGGGGSNDGVFTITFDPENTTFDKTFSEVRTAVLNNALIVIRTGKYVGIPNSVMYTDEETDITIRMTGVDVDPLSTPIGYIDLYTYILTPNNRLTMSDTAYSFTVTEVNE